MKTPVITKAAALLGLASLFSISNPARGASLTAISSLTELATAVHSLPLDTPRAGRSPSDLQNMDEAFREVGPVFESLGLDPRLVYSVALELPRGLSQSRPFLKSLATLLRNTKSAEELPVPAADSYRAAPATINAAALGLAVARIQILCVGSRGLVFEHGSYAALAGGVTTLFAAAGLSYHGGDTQSMLYTMSGGMAALTAYMSLAPLAETLGFSRPLSRFASRQAQETFTYELTRGLSQAQCQTMLEEARPAAETTVVVDNGGFDYNLWMSQMNSEPVATTHHHSSHHHSNLHHESHHHSNHHHQSTVDAPSSQSHSSSSHHDHNSSHSSHHDYSSSHHDTSSSFDFGGHSHHH